MTRFQWLPGMADIEGSRVVATDDGLVLLWTTPVGDGSQQIVHMREDGMGGFRSSEQQERLRAVWLDATPDLNDPATIGGFDRLNSERWGETFHVIDEGPNFAARVESSQYERGWLDLALGDTRGEALMKALVRE